MFLVSTRGSHSAPRNPRSKRRRMAMLIMGGILLPASAAFAFFSIPSNNGTGHIQVGANGESFSVVLAAPSGTPLTPGSGTETVNFTVTNTTSQSEVLHSETYSVVADPNGDIYDMTSGTPTSVAGCSASWFVAGGGDGGVVLPTTLAPGAGLLNGQLQVTMPADSNDNETACSSTEPEVEVTVS